MKTLRTSKSLPPFSFPFLSFTSFRPSHHLRHLTQKSSQSLLPMRRQRPRLRLPRPRQRLLHRRPRLRPHPRRPPAGVRAAAGLLQRACGGGYRQGRGSFVLLVCVLVIPLEGEWKGGEEIETWFSNHPSVSVDCASGWPNCSFHLPVAPSLPCPLYFSLPDNPFIRSLSPNI